MIAYGIKANFVFRTQTEEIADALIEDYKTKQWPSEGVPTMVKVVKEERNYGTQTWWRVLMTLSYGSEKDVVDEPDAEYEFNVTAEESVGGEE